MSSSSQSQSQSSHGGNRYNIGRKQDPVRLNYVKVDKAHMRCKTCNNILTNEMSEMADFALKVKHIN